MIPYRMSKFQLPYSTLASNKKLAFTNARIIDPKTGYDKKGEVLVIGDKIADFGSNIIGSEKPSELEIIDCAGNILAPGLIDIQVHFRDPGQTHKEDLVSGSMSAVAGGVTTVVCQPNTSPVIDSVLVLEYLRLKAREQAYCNVKAYASISRGMKGEELSDMHSLVEAGAVGFTDDGLPLASSLLMRRAFEYSSNLGVVIAQHAEDLALTNKGCINEGRVALELGVRGIPNVSESAVVWRDVAVLEAVSKITKSKPRYHLLHASTKESLEAIKWAKDKGLAVTCEASPHHFTLTEDQVLISGTNAKMNPPLRSEEDRLALIAGLKSGLIDAIATDHAPHDLASKERVLEDATFGIVGVETMLPLSLALFHKGEMGLLELLATMTHKAAQIIGYEGGVIKKGAPADLVVIDLNKEYVVRCADFYSRSKNSPFEGAKLKGRAIKTIVAGKLVFQI